MAYESVPERRKTAKHEYDCGILAHHYDVKVAKELGYPPIVIEKIQKEKDPIARVRILIDARHGLYDEGGK